MRMMARPLGAAAAALAVLVALLMTASSSAAREFVVGGRDGWTPNPGEPHNHWAERNRFQVNDTLVFRYNKDVDGVLRVTQSHYDACDTSSPVLRLDGGGGESRFVFPDSGSYFFISADAGRCKAGERLIVVVLAVRSPPLPPPTSSAPPPKPASSSAPPPPQTPKPAPPPSAPKPASSSPPPPPPVPSAAPQALPPPPPPSSPSAGNASYRLRRRH
ncbi:hypothetical protein QOZ80_1BG0051310 [Eleusine coracana subsp. coracana]|nr:hypothetical protein QOZ80_1BG0051310 [Eleusine coracana subsp. coracana]